VLALSHAQYTQETRREGQKRDRETIDIHGMNGFSIATSSSLIIVDTNVCIYLFLLLHRPILFFSTCPLSPPSALPSQHQIRYSATKSPNTNIKKYPSSVCHPHTRLHQICKNETRGAPPQMYKSRDARQIAVPEQLLSPDCSKLLNDSMAISRTVKMHLALKALVKLPPYFGKPSNFFQRCMQKKGIEHASFIHPPYTDFRRSEIVSFSISSRSL
jgi:hypothetical protein